MKFRWNNYFLLVILAIAIAGILFGLDSDLEVLSKASIPNKQPGIVVNQVGYLPQWQKIAFFRQNLDSDFKTRQPDTVRLIDRDTEKEITTLSLASAVIDPDNQEAIATIDLSAVTQPGNYYLRSDKFQSAPFAIGNDIYKDSLVKLLRSYYLLRCGVAIDDPVSGITHPPCHLKDGIIAHSESEEKIDTVGGWHDGGSYNKYTATTTVAIARLLSLYEQNPALFPDSQLNIPESDNDKSDLLDEMELALDWLLKMQRNDGAVYRKVGGTDWALDLAPDEDIQPRYVYGISTPETAKFAATMAIASRNFSSIDSAKANKYITAANSAWQYLETQPTMLVDWQEDDDLGSDKYLASEDNQEQSLTTDVDDRLWAAAELYIATGNSKFASYFADNLDAIAIDSFSWKNPATLGMTNYLQQQRQPTSEIVLEKIKTKIRQQADSLLKTTQQNPYKLASNLFIWGSNRAIAEAGIVLVKAYQITNNQQYLNAAISQLDYLLGRNHFDRTFITDVGENPVKYLSNIYTRAKQIKIPGLMVSGANATAIDGRVYPNKGYLSYADDELSYATNGNATDYNAAAIGLIVNLITHS